MNEFNEPMEEPLEETIEEPIEEEVFEEPERTPEPTFTPKRQPEERNEGTGLGGCLLPLFVALGFGCLLFWLLNDGVGKSASSNNVPKENVKVVSEAEWHSLEMEIALMQSDIAELKGNTAKVLTMMNFTQNHNTTEATVKLRNNTKKTIYYVRGRLFYCSMNNKVIAFKDFHQKMQLAPGMAITLSVRGAQLPERYFYHKNAPSGTDSNDQYKVYFRAMQVE